MPGGQANQTEYRPPGSPHEDRIVQGLADALDYVFECKREREASLGNADMNKTVSEDGHELEFRCLS